MQPTTFIRAIALLQSRLQELDEKKAEIDAERADISKELGALMGAPQGPVRVANGHSQATPLLPGMKLVELPLTLAEAIDSVLTGAVEPLTLAEIQAQIGQLKLPLRGRADIGSIRSVVHRKQEAMHWTRAGMDGDRIRWAKATEGAR